MSVDNILACVTILSAIIILIGLLIHSKRRNA